MEANLIMPGNYGPDEIKGMYPCVPSENLTWNGSSSELSIWVDSPGGANEYEVLLDQILSSDSKYKVMVLMEPASLCPRNYKFALHHEDLFDMVLSTYPDFCSNNPDKFKYYPGGCRTFIPTDERLVYEKTKNISGIVSIRHTLPGHKVRHYIKNYHQENQLGLIDYLNPPMGRKVDGIKDYRFEVVIENEDSPCFSEKLLDPMLCGTIPIYWSPTETSYLNMFDMNGIITFNSIEEFFEMLNGGYFNENLYISKLESVKTNFDIAKNYISLGDVLWEHGIKNLFGQ